MSAAVEVVAPACEQERVTRTMLRHGRRDAGRLVGHRQGTVVAREARHGLRFGSGGRRGAEVRGLTRRLKAGSGRASVRQRSAASRSVARGNEPRGDWWKAGFGSRETGRPVVEVLGPAGSRIAERRCFGTGGQGSGGQVNRAVCSWPAKGNRGRQPGAERRRTRGGRKQTAQGRFSHFGGGAGRARRATGGGESGRYRCRLRSAAGPPDEAYRGGGRTDAGGCHGRSNRTMSGCEQRVSARFTWQGRVV
jgi:hypothetical protein